MARKNLTDQTPAELTTTLQVAQVALARAASWANYNGYDIESYVAACGLSQYHDGAKTSVTVDLKAVLAAIGDTFTVVASVADGQITDPYSVREAVRGHLYHTATLPDGAWTVQPKSPDAIVPSTYLGGTWNIQEFPVPVLATDEARVEARRIVSAVLVHAQEHGACGAPENLIRNIGFGAFLPARETTMTADVPGIGVVGFVVDNDRTGKPDRSRLEIKLRNAVGAKLMELAESGALTFTTTGVTA